MKRTICAGFAAACLSFSVAGAASAALPTTLSDDGDPEIGAELSAADEVLPVEPDSEAQEAPADAPQVEADSLTQTETSEVTEAEEETESSSGEDSPPVAEEPDEAPPESAEAPPAAPADLEVRQLGPEIVNADNDITWLLAVSNLGGQAATDIVLTDIIPQDMIGTSFDSPEMVCQFSTETWLRCELDSLAAGATTNLEFTASFPDGYCLTDPVINTVTVLSALAEADAALANNTSDFVSAPQDGANCPSGPDHVVPPQAPADPAPQAPESQPAPAPPAASAPPKEVPVARQHTPSQNMPHTGASTTLIGTLAGISILSGGLLLLFRRAKA